jgi:membrane protein YqaA with SNARE-associated domain
LIAAIETLLRTATGPGGIVLVFVYSVLVAFVLPLPGELVLVPAPRMVLGVSPAASVAIVVLVSAAGKAVGSVLALRLGRAARSAAPSRWLLARVAPGYRGQDRNGPLVRFVHRYGYVGLGLVLSVPLLPDTAVVYAFSVMDADERRFAVAVFLGTVGRLLVALALVGGALAVT